MNKKEILSIIFFTALILGESVNTLIAQNNNVGIGTTNPAPSALLDIDASPLNNKGLLMPRLTAIQRLAIPTPSNSLLVFDTDSACFFYWDAVASSWKSLCNTGATGTIGITGVTGDNGTMGATGMIGSTGSPGSAGNTGGTGLIGSSGTTGASGIIGSTGSSGSAGNTGETGSIGSSGTTGASGSLGVTGFTGAIGFTGNTGSTGITGLIGFTGATGNDLGTHWTITGNANTIAGTNFLGTTDAVDLAIFTNNTEKIRITSSGIVGIGNASPSSSALVDITTTNKGFAMPRLTTAQRLAISVPIDGLQVYDTNLKGFYFFNGTNWNCVTTPAGTVDYFANSTSPVGYLECNGQAVSRTQYPELFTAIGIVYGAGNGTTTFNVPDLRGEFIRGADNGKGIDAGRVIGTGQAGTLIVGDFDPTPTPGSLYSASGTYQNLYGADPFDASSYSPATTQAAFATSSVVAATAASLPGYFGITRPRNVALLPCIKY